MLKGEELESKSEDLKATLWVPGTCPDQPCETPMCSCDITCRCLQLPRFPRTSACLLRHWFIAWSLSNRISLKEIWVPLWECLAGSWQKWGLPQTGITLPRLLNSHFVKFHPLCCLLLANWEHPENGSRVWQRNPSQQDWVTFLKANWNIFPRQTKALWQLGTKVATWQTCKMGKYCSKRQICPVKY